MKQHRAVSWVCLLALAGCALETPVPDMPPAIDPVPPSPPVRVVSAAPEPQISALDYFYAITAAPEGELANEQLQLEAQNPWVDYPIPIVSLALLLSAPNRLYPDERRALALLETLPPPASGDTRANEFHRLGILWRDVLRQRAQLRDSVMDERKEARQDLALVEKDLEDSYRQIDDLRRQIEALKSIEKQINRREQVP